MYREQMNMTSYFASCSAVDRRGPVTRFCDHHVLEALHIESCHTDASYTVTMDTGKKSHCMGTTGSSYLLNHRLVY